MPARMRQERTDLDETVRRVLQSPGSPLDADLRRLVEDRFGRDFGHVRVHADEQAARSARRLDARAYTVGAHIVFAENCYPPQTRDDLWLLCHELAHVVQQGGDRPATSLWLSEADDPLEQAADHVADLVAAGSALPPDFAFSAAPAGIVQRHQDAPCLGMIITPNEPGRQGIGGNWAIELAYKQAHEDHADALFFGSQYEGERFGADVLLPKGAPNKAFGDMLLSRLRGLQNQRRPDIIDFKRRVFYEIKTPRFVDSGMVQLGSYYKIANELIREYAAFREPAWKRSEANWYPPHMLPYPGDWKAIVCTQETDHGRYPGMILYDIRKKPGRRRDAQQVPARRIDYLSIDRDFQSLSPTIVDELRKQLRYYDPDEPRYVIIMPREIYRKWPHQQNPLWEKLRVEPTYGDAPGGSYVKHVKGQLYTVAAIVSVVGIALLLVIAGGALIYVISASSAAAATGAGAAGAGTGAGEIISLAAYRAARAAPVVQNLAKAAGVLLVIGAMTDVEAANPTVQSANAIRLVPVGDFQMFGGMPTAGEMADGLVSTSLASFESRRGKFELGSFVQYDFVEHIVIGQVGVS